MKPEASTNSSDVDLREESIMEKMQQSHRADPAAKEPDTEPKTPVEVSLPVVAEESSVAEEPDAEVPRKTKSASNRTREKPSSKFSLYIFSSISQFSLYSYDLFV